MTTKCKVCGYEYGVWRAHCPACSTFSVNFAGRKWATKIDGRLDREIGRARNARPVEQVFQQRISTQLVD